MRYAAFSLVCLVSGCLEVAATAPTDAGGNAGTSSSSTGGSPAPMGVALVLAPNPMSFGYVPEGVSASACTTLTNASNIEVTVTGLSDFDTVDGSFALVTAFPLTLAGGASAEICFSFVPTDCDGVAHGPGHATLVTNLPNVPNLVIELGEVFCGGGPKIACTPLALDFGTLRKGSTSIQAVICTNTGTAIPGVNLNLQPPTTSSSRFSAAFDSGRDPYPPGGLTPGEAVRIDVTYAPTGPANDTGTLFIASNGGPTIEIAVSGDGAP